MKRWSFEVTLSGVGNSPEEAFADAVEQFADDPGEPNSRTFMGDLDEEETE